MPWFRSSPKPVSTPAPVDVRPRVRISNEQQWKEIKALAGAKFLERFPGATITKAILHNPNGDPRGGVTFNISVPNFRVEGTLSDGRTAMIEGLMSPLHIGAPIGDTKVTSFVNHVSPKPNSGRGVADI